MWKHLERHLKLCFVDAENAICVLLLQALFSCYLRLFAGCGGLPRRICSFRLHYAYPHTAGFSKSGDRVSSSREEAPTRPSTPGPALLPTAFDPLMASPKTYSFFDLVPSLQNSIL